MCELPIEVSVLCNALQMTANLQNDSYVMICAGGTTHSLYFADPVAASCLAKCVLSPFCLAMDSQNAGPSCQFGLPPMLTQMSASMCVALQPLNQHRLIGGLKPASAKALRMTYL